ncbi:uncharacterized protein OCT59_010112 [Rhizophagus irregularis]|uniref:Uncharacterized protein n=1 Tax=Rhizophagus irregularis (strain DAOM 197198w) TaxID=1432141 RepID=A0A015I1A8_RHIIW|nr:hypothetical protein RirG_268080 [Rhizophagus irregularis DAOM 197198w]UZO18803.1 hypothetical protein OCT59_010112 [Rhizophagus irregularis]GBC38794.1 hypothetical protein RIR_jg4104.t1 [Rhizophagus irregularis DAOM 181602=DAOM 197198]
MSCRVIVVGQRVCREKGCREVVRHWITYIRRTRGSGKPEDRIEETRAKSKVHIEETKVRIEEIKIRIEETGETEVRIKATKVRQKIVLKL